MTMIRSGNSIMPEHVLVVFSNSHDTIFASWQFFTEHIVVVTKHPRRGISCRGRFDIATTRSGCFFPLTERFPSLSLTYTFLIYKIL
jgi:hypothetical protein